MDERDDDLLDEEPLGLFEQDGPDLFDSPEPASTAEADDWIDAELDTLETAEQPAPTAAAEADASEVDARLAAALDSVTAGHRHERVDRPEAPLALYRRYRPDTFADIIGQDHVTEPLQRALVNNRVNHAYLFSGPRGCGKTTSARILARALNCVSGPAPIPCGECQSCRDLARGGAGSIDVIEIDAASHGGVNEARDLRERAFFAPVHSRYKIYIIDEAHMVTKEGFNALLKVVEEPPPHVKFIFATTEPDKVLGTIRSRTHHYPFRLVPPKTLTAYLSGLCVAEGVEVEPSVLPLVVRAGAGSVRDSLSVLDQLLGGAGTAGVTYRQATALLGYTPDALLDEIMDAFAAGDAQGVFAAVDKVIEVGQDPRRFAEDLLRRLRDLIIVAAVPDALSSGLVDVAHDQGQRLSAQARAMGAGELTRAAEVLAAGLTDMRGTTAPRLHLELMCARVLLPGADVDGRGVHARLDRLERRLGMPSAAGAGAEPTPTPTRGGDAAAPVRESAARQPEPGPEHAPLPPATRSSEGVPTAARPDAPARATPDPPARATPDAPAAATQATAATPPRPSEARVGSASEPGLRRSDARDHVTPGRSDHVTPGRSDHVSPGRSDHVSPGRGLQGSPGEDAAGRPSAPMPNAPPGGALTTADLRRLWPDVLDEVKNRRRFTWILLSQNAQVIELRQGVLTLGIANAGARDSYSRGGSDEVLREAILTVVGATLRIDVIIDPGLDAAGRPGEAAGTGARPAATDAAAVGTAARPPADSSAAGTTEAASASAGDDSPPWSTEEPTGPAAPSGPPSPDRPRSPSSPRSPRSPRSPGSPSSPAGPDLVAAARANIRPTRTTALAEAPDEEPSRDDLSVEEADASFDELLVKHLGAELIGEEEVTPGQ